MSSADMEKFSTSVGPEVIFILTTDRSGSKSIADLLSTLAGCVCLHEPEPLLVRESAEFRYGRRNQRELVESLRRSRFLNGQQRVYGESNQTLSLIIPALREAFPKARYIWLVRNGIDMVASAVGRNWYRGLSIDEKTYEQSHCVGQEWMDGRVQGHLCGDVAESEWTRMSAFDKCCWYWGYINRVIENDLRSHVDSASYRLVKLEELETSTDILASWIGLDVDENLIVPHQNRAHYSVHSPQGWSDSQWKSFERWCGPLMDRLYPSWRQTHHYYRQIAKAELLIERNQLQQAEKLLNSVCMSCVLDARGHNLIGILRLNKGDMLKAKQSYEVAVALDPDNICFLLNLADLLLVVEHQPESALELYSRVLGREPSNPQALMNKLVACLQLGRIEQAQEIESILRTLSPDNLEVQQCLQQLRETGFYRTSAKDSEQSQPFSNSTATSSAAPRAIFNSSSSSNLRGDCDTDNATNLAAPEIQSTSGQLLQAAAGDQNHEGLKCRLEKIGWSSKNDLYEETFSWVRRLRIIEKAKISIIVISWRFHPDTLTSFKILNNQRDQAVELIFVDNGSPDGSFRQLEEYIDTYVRLNTNAGCCVARNIGAVFANSPILLFLDDDGVPNSNIVSAHLNAHESYDVFSVRGVCLAKNNSNRFNLIAKHYYLGDRPFPRYADLEGNSSYRAETFYAVGGWDDQTHFGSEGVELSFRLWKHEPDWCKQIYSPEPILRHDYAKDHGHFQQKAQKIRSQMQQVENKNPGFKEFMYAWKQFYFRSDLIKSRHAQKPKTEKTGELGNASIIQVPTVSIVIPTHNRCQFLKQALESAFSQTSQNYEIVVVDDGSTDGTQDFLRGLECDRLHYTIKSRTGAPNTRNCGIEMAKGQYILWLDDDDLLASDAVAKHTEILHRHPESDVVYGVLQYFENNSGAKLNLFDPRDWSMNSDMMLSSLVAGNCIPNPGTLVRRSCYEKIGGYDTTFTRAHDYEFWSRAAGHFKFRKNHTMVCQYRIHTTNLSGGRMVDRSYESLVIRRMVVRYGLEKIYHWFDWSYPEAAEVAALFTVSNNLSKIGDWYHSALFLEKVPIHLWTADIAELALNCMLFQGRWKHYGNLLDQVKNRNILVPSHIKLFRQKADCYRRFTQGLRQALYENEPQKITAYVNHVENSHFPLSPNSAVQLASHLLNFKNDQSAPFSTSMSLKLLQKALMTNPADPVLYEQIRSLPISASDRDTVVAIRNRMLPDWDDLNHHPTDGRWAVEAGHGASQAISA